MTANERASAAEVCTGRVVRKCEQAMTAARRSRVTIGDAILPSSLQTLGKFVVNRTASVIGLWVHDNPFVVLSTDGMVYVDGSEEKEKEEKEEEEKEEEANE